ncbi:MAG: kelch repeat-containing protein, partial [Syntrophobacteraceae bacterium]
ANFTTSCEIYDPSTGAWTPTGSLSVPHAYHAAILLQSGKVLVIGGLTSGWASTSDCEIYDPSTGMWSPTGSLIYSYNPCWRDYDYFVGDGWTATLLPSGEVLLVGGFFGDIGFPENSCEIYNPSTGVWTGAPALLDDAVANQTATLLPNGKVLLAGAYDGVRSCEIYDPSAEEWTWTGYLQGTGSNFYTATLLQNGRVLVAGGEFSEDLATGFGGGSYSQIYDPSIGSWTAVGELTDPRIFHTATLLLNGDVLVAGGVGSNATDILSSCEIYNPSSPTGPGAPTGVIATAGSQQATVSFTAPASNGGSPITGYTVSGGGLDTNAGTMLTTHLITYLTNGTAYTFTVQATNAVGQGYTIVSLQLSNAARRPLGKRKRPWWWMGLA